VAVTIITASAALIGVIVGQFLNRNSEHTRWLRQERLTAAAELVRACDEVFTDQQIHSLLEGRLGEGVVTSEVIRRVVGHSGEPIARTIELWAKAEHALATVRLVFPKNVSNLGEGLRDAVRTAGVGADATGDTDHVTTPCVEASLKLFVSAVQKLLVETHFWWRRR
jgi:hypothetical protein